MPIETICPECGRALRVPDHLIGQAVQCPVCPAMFTAVAAPDAKPNDAPVETFREPMVSPEGPPPSPPPIEEPVRRPRPRLDGDYDDDDLDDEDDENLIDVQEVRYRERRQRRLRDEARSKIAVPAIGLMVVGGLNLIEAVGSLLMGVYFIAAAPGRGRAGGAVWGQLVVFGVGALLLAVPGVLILIGAIRMKQQRLYGLAMTACILAAISSVSLGLCCMLNLVVGLTFSIWGFVVLFDPNVKASFK
jgi:hypothetical protein